MRRGEVIGTVLAWNDEEGWGVLESADAAGPVWAHFSAIADMRGYRALSPGQRVRFSFEAADQDGFSLRALNVVTRP